VALLNRTALAAMLNRPALAAMLNRTALVAPLNRPALAAMLSHATYSRDVLYPVNYASSETRHDLSFLASRSSLQGYNSCFGNK
jgi:hypothetical protein